MALAGTTIQIVTDDNQNAERVMGLAKNESHRKNINGILNWKRNISNRRKNMSSNKNTSSCGCGLGIGGTLAVIMSWVSNHSILWAIFHAFCGWLYVIYWTVFRLPTLK
jgi:hypothetical protein